MNRQGFGFQTFEVRGGDPEKAELRQQVQALAAQVKHYEAGIAALQAEPFAIFTVIAVTGQGRGLIAGNPPIEINLPLGAVVGSQLRCLPSEKNGFSLLPEPVLFGLVVSVEEVLGRQAVVLAGTTPALVAIADGLELKAGDRAVLDPHKDVALRKLPPVESSLGAVATPTVSWSDIGGQDEAIEALREAVEYPTRFAELYAAHGQKPARGAMLYGQPGTGKTLLAKALAASLGGGFFYIKATEVMSKWQGESGAAVRGLFRRARKHQAETGKRAVLFLDEADSLLGVRDGAGQALGGSLEDMVPVFLAEMDGLDALGPFVLLATNRPDRIDPAVLRDGRCETKVHVRRPDRVAAERLFALALRGRRVDDAGAVAMFGACWLFDERHKLLELSYRGVPNPELVWLHDLASGAMIEGIVQKAAAAAIKRDRDAGALSSIGRDDIVEAVKLTLRQQVRVNHDQVIAEKSAPYGRAPEKVRRLVEA